MRRIYPDYWQKHHRKSIRLPNRDYADPGMYYVTICTAQRECTLGEIVDGTMQLNEFGRCVEAALRWLPQKYDYVKLDTFVLMPNHIHMILIFDERCRGGSRTAPTTPRKPLGRMVGVFKTISTKQINILRHAPGERVWQRNYYERVIRNDAELRRIRLYISNNPKNWDRERL